MKMMPWSPMLALESPYWLELDHAYGAASDTPLLLKALHFFPDESDHTNEPWFTLWSSLLHQGDIYPASFAAVPHIVDALAKDPERATMSYFLLPAGIEVARSQSNEPIPHPLEPAYRRALARLPALVAAAARSDWDPVVSSAAFAALAAACGRTQLAELLMEVEEKEIAPAIDWLKSSR